MGRPTKKPEERKPTAFYLDKARPCRQPGAIMHIRGIPNDVRAAFRAYCARRDRPMKDVFIALIKYCVKKELRLDIPRNPRNTRNLM